MIRILEEHHGRVHFLGQLLSGDGNPAGIFQRAEKLQLVSIQNCDARSPRVHLHHERRTLSLSDAEGSQPVGDRRVWRLHLTPAAAPILREISKYRAEIHEVITAGMSPAIQKAITDGLTQMKANLAAEARAVGKAAG